MRYEHSFADARPLARHCPELLKVAEVAPDDSQLLLARFTALFARGLAAELAAHSGEESLQVAADAPRELGFAALAAEIAPLAANSLLSCGDARMLLSIEAEVVLRMLDRAFGGRGLVPNHLPEKFPLSTELMIARLEALVSRALGETLDAPSPTFMARNSSLTELAPFSDEQAMCVLSFVIAAPDQAPWRLTLAIAQEALPGFLGRASSHADVPSRLPASPQDKPFADLPLTLRAVLVEMPIGVAALAQLRPGQVLPVAVARSVPLRIGHRTLAHGTIGEVDDRVAVQITHAF